LAELAAEKSVFKPRDSFVSELRCQPVFFRRHEFQHSADLFGRGCLYSCQKRSASAEEQFEASQNPAGGLVTVVCTELSVEVSKFEHNGVDSIEFKQLFDTAGGICVLLQQGLHFGVANQIAANGTFAQRISQGAAEQQ
jgi:hypothetical protein